MPTNPARTPCPPGRAPWLVPSNPDRARAYFRELASDTGLSPESVYLELTKQAKIDRIAALGCDVFVDDLPRLGSGKLDRLTLAQWSTQDIAT